MKTLKQDSWDLVNIRIKKNSDQSNEIGHNNDIIVYKQPAVVF